MLQQIYPQVSHNYSFELNKDLQFAAAHYIPHEEAGKCQQMHGHTYFANITIAGDELDDSGFLFNFSKIKELIHRRFDHSVLNEHTDVFKAGQFPTTEVIAKKVYEIIQAELDTLPHKPQCLQVFLRETPTSYCLYRPKRRER